MLWIMNGSGPFLSRCSLTSPLWALSPRLGMPLRVDARPCRVPRWLASNPTTDALIGSYSGRGWFLVIPAFGKTGGAQSGAGGLPMISPRSFRLPRSYSLTPFPSPAGGPLWGPAGPLPPPTGGGRGPILHVLYGVSVTLAFLPPPYLRFRWSRSPAYGCSCI